MSNLVERLRDEADLCRNDGAEDIASLLDEAADELQRLAAAPAVPAPVEPVATLHDDGCFTWKRDEFRLKYDRQRAGWRMDVYAAQPSAEPAPSEPVAWRKTVGAMARTLEQCAKHTPDSRASTMREFSARLNLLLVAPQPAAQPSAEPVATVTECEACFTPDACQLRGTCDHYSAERLRVAKSAQPSAEPAPDALDLDDLLVVRHLNPRQPGETLRQAVDRILNWEAMVNLDPAVSSAAAALVESGRKSAQPSAEPADPLGVQPCCGEFATCPRPCTPRGEWIATNRAQPSAKPEPFSDAWIDGILRAAQPSAAPEAHCTYPRCMTTGAKCVGACAAAQPSAELPDSVRVPLHRLWADAGYLVGRAVNGERDLAIRTIKALCDEVEAAVRALPGAAQPSAEPPVAWVPVTERMPKSGQTVLACYTNAAGKVRRIRAEWVAAKSVEASGDSDIGVYDEATDTYYDPEGWYEKIDNWDDYSAVVVTQGEVTHWMPLPAAPGAAQPSAEPAPKSTHCGDMSKSGASVNMTQPSAEPAQPVATVIKKGADRQWMSERLYTVPDGTYSLYLAPQPSAEPLTLEQIHAMPEWWPSYAKHESLIELVRAVERAHGIGGKP